MPFSASIVNRVFSCVPDKVIRLGGASWLRPMGGPTLPANWERIRFGVLCAVTPNGTSNISDALFLLGLTASTTAPGSAYSTDNFLGLSVIGSPVTASTRQLTYTAGSGNPYYSCTGGVAFHKVNNTILTNSAASTAMLLPLAQTGVYFRRAIVIVDITRPTGGIGSTTIVVYCNTTAATAQTIDFRPDDLFDALDQPGQPTLRGGSVINSVLSTTAVNYSPVGGDVDTFEIFWSSNTFPLEISAIGATVIRPLGYTDVGFASDTFESYAVSAGSIAPVDSFLDSGSGWSTPGSVISTWSYNDGSLANASNFAPQIYGQYNGTVNSPSDGFETYAAGSVYGNGTLDAGTYWASAIYILPPNNYNDGTNAWSSNLGAQVYGQYVGTTTSPDDPFEQYPTGTIDSDITLNQGTFWTAPATIIISRSNDVPQVYSELAGTNFSPYDTFESYATNATGSYVGAIDGGGFWAAYGTVYSTGSVLFAGTTISNLAPLIGSQALAGTAYSPYDTFESYGTGTVVSGVTIDAGSYWSGAGSVYTFSYP